MKCASCGQELPLRATVFVRRAGRRWDREFESHGDSRGAAGRRGEFWIRGAAGRVRLETRARQKNFTSSSAPGSRSQDSRAVHCGDDAGGALPHRFAAGGKGGMGEVYRAELI